MWVNKIYCIQFIRGNEEEKMNPIKFVWRNILARKYLWQYFSEVGKIWDDRLKETLAFAEEGSVKSDYSSSIAYLRENGSTFYPYEGNIWGKRPLLLKYPIFWNGQDETYMYYKGKKIWCKFRPFVGIIVEQDKRSPHRYFTDSFHVEEGEIFVDVGAAEGMISLDSIDKVKKAYLIEGNEESWKGPLEKTFSPYKEKTNIIYKFAADHCDAENISLDELLKDDMEAKGIMVKMDVEGNEMNVLRGAERLLQRDNVRFAVCTYHQEGDEEKLQRFFEERGYQTEFSDGYMWVPLFSEKAPYLRKGVLRAWKNA